MMMPTNGWSLKIINTLLKVRLLSLFIQFIILWLERMPGKKSNNTQNLHLHVIWQIELLNYLRTLALRLYSFFSFFAFRFSFGLSWAFFCCSLLPLSFFPLSPISLPPCLKMIYVGLWRRTPVFGRVNGSTWHRLASLPNASTMPGTSSKGGWQFVPTLLLTKCGAGVTSWLGH